MKRTKHFLLLFIKGMSMGIAELIPSISSATIALITGIYGKLLDSIRSVDMAALRLLIQGKWKAFWDHINGNFLLTLGLGILTSLLSTISLLRYLLAEKPIQIWSFFFGLMVISCISIYQYIKKFTLMTLLVSFLGALIAYGLIYTTPLKTPDSLWFISLAGVIAVCAMILPGISGSFMLLLLGKYTLMLEALQGFHWQRLLAFLLGAITGLISFTRFLNWLLRQYHDYTMALLAGFMLGSLPKTWPWKQLIQPLDVDPLVEAAMEKNVSPVKFQLLAQQDPLILEALLWMSLGCLLVVLLEKLAANQRDRYRSLELK
jgi:putative membrane protein